MTAVLVLNAHLGPLHRVTLRHAIRMLARQVAEVHEAWSRPGVPASDGRRCAFCGGHASTIGHVVPRSRGGGNEWGSTVDACERCNGRTPGEAGMPLRVQPAAPTWAALAAQTLP